MHHPLPLYEEKSSLRADGSRDYVHPADVHGRFTRAKRWLFPLLIAVYIALPWWQIDGRPAVFLDVPQRCFYLFGAVFNAQDFWLVFFLLTGIGFALILLTTLFGRVWCGYGCPQTVFLEGVFRRIERWIEGPRGERLRLNKARWGGRKIAKKVVKHLLFLLLATAVAHIFLSYFVSIPALLTMLRQSPAQHPTAFAWVAVVTALTYGNFAWFREQVCLIICPYGRLQSAMTDTDTLVIGYDRQRGEPRAHLSQQQRATDAHTIDNDTITSSQGDCIDCHRCVAVCPTGIDIRNGLQIDCIGCAACVDACDEVMTRIGRPTGLVRYDSQRGLSAGKRRFWRPRVLVYAALGILGLTVTAFAITRHQSFEAQLLRASTTPFVVASGMVRNSLSVHVVNKSSQARTFILQGLPGQGLRYIIPIRTVTLPAMQSQHVPVMVLLPVDQAKARLHAHLQIHPQEAPEEAQQLRTPFVVPKTP